MSVIDTCQIEVRTDVSNRTSFGYSDTEKDRIEFLETGNGTLNDIKRLFADDKIRFCVFCLEYLQPGFVEKVKKYILITMVGPSVPPLKKARSSGQRQGS